MFHTGFSCVQQLIADLKICVHVDHVSLHSDLEGDMDAGQSPSGWWIVNAGMWPATDYRCAHRVTIIGFQVMLNTILPKEFSGDFVLALYVRICRKTG